MVCKKLVGHALSVPDREERHLLSEDLGSGEPVSRASARKETNEIVLIPMHHNHVLISSPEKIYISDKMSEKFRQNSL